MTMSILADWMPLAPLTDEEFYGTGVSIKKELSEDISEDTCIEIKEEQFDYAEKPFSCEICNKAFSKKKTLVQHMRVHTKEKPFSCEICSKAFSDKGTLVKQLRVHTKEKPYSCEICRNTFSQKGSLERHMEVHTKEKPFSCEICSKAFSVKDTLIKHIRYSSRAHESTYKGEAIQLLHEEIIWLEIREYIQKEKP
ncbi:gastrula zinc finger protein XlCGF71.1-like [Penaeus chinensis]|uniref:gastrula zinc finger protein XlCGF71.1-like n=1 Tax=Penaeus chinensis TaxID=139456 RepID=UPI001FB5A78C|nr:gastrula zinc finger protein XlCGF71.1-like [Penaeus chinensis]